MRLVRHLCTSSVSECGLGVSKWSLTEIQLCACARPLALMPSTFGAGHVANMLAFTENIQILPALCQAEAEMRSWRMRQVPDAGPTPRAENHDGWLRPPLRCRSLCGPFERVGNRNVG